ncbi:PilZ domain-containing protein [Vibrio cincinnatiensis]|uniref:PilZ domain-containing protein n=1 Tax=Vibrio cincinnatiensis TaxID=675 RepID=UPI001EDEEADA|nr:flagellar brake protein [Vibrio cincinnatiensis]MCG3728800.1 flagellar brake protein [Vibrio cincinnatiensis]
MRASSMATHTSLGSSMLSSSSKTVSTINSVDALAMVEHGSELTLSITTPVGTKFLCKTPFIGTHSNTYLLIEIPQISAEDLHYFFQEGFWIHIRAISPRGEGAMLYFRSQLLHILHDPIALAMLSIPNTMQVTQLRKEPRYEVNLSGKVICEQGKSECEVRDLSKSGCRFLTAPLGRHLQMDDHVAIEIFADKRGSKFFAPLMGRICNLQRSTHYARYGLEFNEQGRENAKNLLGKLKFNGTKLTLNIDHMVKE